MFPIDQVIFLLQKVLSMLQSQTKIDSKVEYKTEPKSEQMEVYNDIQADKPKEVIIHKKTSNPFLTTNIAKPIVIGTSPWTDLYENIIKRAGDETTPMSQRTVAYIKKKLPKDITEKAIYAKIYRMGYHVKKGKVCLKA